MRHSIFSIIVIGLTAGACEEEPVKNTFTSTGDPDSWRVPVGEVVSGGVSKDGIIALVNPDRKPVDDPDHQYLAGDDLVLGYKSGDDLIFYPHAILDYHEIVNDRAGQTSFALTYCPLTGTGIAWDRVLEGEETTFGVSGLLYNANLIPYDRKTHSNWSQIRGDCINGALIKTEATIHPLVEMTWKVAKDLYPEAMVLSRSTGYGLGYNHYPYGDYKTSSSFVVAPVSRDYRDLRLDFKERVLAVIKDRQAKVYRFESFGPSLRLIQDQFQDLNLVVAGVRDEFMVAYNAEIEPGVILEFIPLTNGGPAIMKDQEGNEWSIFGEALQGPRKGQSLKSPGSYMAYWFSVPAFFTDPLIYGMDQPR